MRNQGQTQKLSDIRQVPATYEQRNCTDILCIIVGCVFSFSMIILAVSLFNFDNYYRSNFPSDSAGRLCGIDHAAKHYPYLYFTQPPNISMRVCVSQCPQPQDLKLMCLPSDRIGCAFTSTPGYEVINYDTEKSETRSGYFCYPTDPTLKQELLGSSKLRGRDQFYNSIDTIRLCFYLSLAFCIAYLGCVQFLPKKTSYVILALGCLIMVACCICIGLYNSNQVLAKGLEIGAILVFLLIVLTSAFRYQSSWRIHAILLDYSKKLVRDRCTILLYILIFFIFLSSFVFLIVFEFAAFWSAGVLTFTPERQVFYELGGQGPIVLTILVAIQAIWGFSFIKASFNFCVSCFTVQWYYDRKSTFLYPFKLLLFKHFGSVIGGAFMSGFLAPFDFLFDAIKPDEESSGFYVSCFNGLRWCTNIFDLVREDAIPYLALTGNPYCNSSRYCEYLCEQSVVMDYSQSTSRSFRLSAHFLISGIMVIMALYIKGEISINSIFIIILLSLSTSTLFISLHCDIAEAMQIIILTDEELVRKASNLHYQVIDQHSIRQQLGRLKLHHDLVRQIMEERIVQKKVEKQEKDKVKLQK